MPILPAAIILFLSWGSLVSLLAVESIDFNRDIRTILSDKCYHCHGPDASNQTSDFRIDSFEEATRDLGGYAGIVPGKPGESAVLQRILSKDPDEMMPPPDANRVLSAREKDLMTAWITAGAEYEPHWAFQRPQRASLPEGNDRHPIDQLIEEEREGHMRALAPQATLEQRIRRAALTLTGLLPPLELMDEALVRGTAGGGYAWAVDQLLGSTDYAERQALQWMDAARYADTDGYQNDSERKNWPWRDWVIQAYHDNMPFDQFTVEQLAGDLLPEASEAQLLATAFNRNHRQNGEGGALAPEFYVENVIDRVETTSTVWLGLTVGCARCHDHKYDPISQREFYQLFAYFNNIGERGIGKGVSANPVKALSSPLVKVPEDLQASLEHLRREEEAAKAGFSNRLASWISRAAAQEQVPWRMAQHGKAEVRPDVGVLVREEANAWRFEGRDVGQLSYRLGIHGDGRSVAAIRLEALPDDSFGAPNKLADSVNGNFVLTEFKVISSRGEVLPISRATATFEQANYPIGNTIDRKSNTGWAIAGQKDSSKSVRAVFVLEKPYTTTPGEIFHIEMHHDSAFRNHHIGKFRLTVSPKVPLASDLPEEVRAAVNTPASARSAEQRQTLTKHFRSVDEVQAAIEKRRKRLEKKLAAHGAQRVPVMVMQEKEGNATPAYLLNRGQYDAPDTSEALPRALPKALFAGALSEQPRNRLALARWLVSRDNPLTARVVVNRIWQSHFGTGLVKTTEDFGVQGELPRLRNLLDWLAVEFIESGWDVKALHRLIVTSAAYQQESRVDAILLRVDPHNRLITRGPRFRLDGFAIRDVALQAADLLNPRLGGPPVKPYQPDGLWNAVANNANFRYVPAKGSDLYRKSLYTYWKRGVNPPRQIIFDASGREVCNVAARRTNTPLHALVLMNDVTFVEAARQMAEVALLEGDYEDNERLSRMYRRATALSVDAERLASLQESLTWFRKHFTHEREAASAFLSAGDSPRNDALPVAEHAAWAAVAHVLLNLDETITVQ